MMKRKEEEEDLLAEDEQYLPQKWFFTVKITLKFNKFKIIDKYIFHLKF